MNRRRHSHVRQRRLKAALRNITVWETMSEVIKNVTDFGVFVNLGDGVTGLIHISQLSSRRLGTPPRSSTSTTASL
jgi:ribosomal protein S1